MQESWALVPGTIAYWMAQANAYDPILYPTLDYGGYEMVGFSDYGVNYDNLIIDRAWPDSQGDQISLLSQFFLISDTPTRPSTSTAFNNAYPNAPWRLVSVTGADFSSSSDQGFENDTYCDPGGGNHLPPAISLARAPGPTPVAAPTIAIAKPPTRCPPTPANGDRGTGPPPDPPSPANTSSPLP
ncbi:MAG: hypothetical protein LVS60_03490 [Nodosilinea sp. LVE1205-7]|jgi:hypothetical protein